MNREEQSSEAEGLFKDSLFKMGASNCTVQLLGNDTCLHGDNTLQGGKKRKRKLKVSMYLYPERKPQEATCMRYKGLVEVSDVLFPGYHSYLL